MPYSVDDAIKDVLKQDDISVGKRFAVTRELIARYERELGLEFCEDYKQFLLKVSQSFVGYLSPLRLDECMVSSPGELLDGVSNAREFGVPSEWLPFCEDNGDYYCLLSSGEVRFWDHNGASTEKWESLAVWIKEVWLEED
ncbi:SMI1/KNR4 family protein [Epibacterium sp. SM1979]|uniref:SMI1/KNR4 family protein n=1 Tax=Tritonibacter litoralis TaxID=2662264 RepID=A0A843YBJ9_9RHOB|nr:SMI1/KNR4 family protein [Tritonibacter litoralis]MQQ08376.1 SMI1/KNR4 family protein [Tritonibacter litoralis]